MHFVESVDQALPAVAEALHAFDVRPRQRGEEYTAAIRTVWRAVDITRMFLTGNRRGNYSVTPSNAQLVDLWSEAALAIAVVDEELAERLRMKAEYWSDPSDWTEAEIERARIGIDLVATEARRLLRSSRVGSNQKQPASLEAPPVFISHASEDKFVVALPLANALVAHGFRVWYDDFTLTLGDNLLQKIDEGLRECRYGVVILSPYFFDKPWTQRELDALVALETSDGRKRILPIWHGVDRDDVVRYSPTLAGRLGVSTSQGIAFVVTQVLRALNRPDELTTHT
jgi:hypothetical protein